MFCSKCGKEIADDAGFCQYCGNQVGATIAQQVQQVVYVQTEKEAKSQFIAIVCCLFLGLIGMHDFYMGKNAAGVIKLLIALLLGWMAGIGLIINGLWCILDFLLIVTKSEDCFYTKKELEEKAEARRKANEEYWKLVEERKRLRQEQNN